MTVVVLGEQPDITAIIARRRELGLVGHDEVWNGVYHLVSNAHSRHGRLEARLVAGTMGGTVRRRR